MMTFDEILRLMRQMLPRMGVALELFGATLLFALPLGVILAFGRMSRFKPLSLVTQAFLLVMRGTPLMLQLIFFMYLTPAYRYTGSRLTVAIIAFSLNYAAYFAEIYRGGIESIPPGQHEAANVLGFSKSQTFFRIIFPQVIKKILPPMGNEFMTLVKDTSLAQIIAVEEIIDLAKSVQAIKVSFIPIVVAGVFYLGMNVLVSIGFNFAEKKFSYYT